MKDNYEPGIDPYEYNKKRCIHYKLGGRDECRRCKLLRTGVWLDCHERPSIYQENFEGFDEKYRKQIGHLK